VSGDVATILLLRDVRVRFRVYLASCGKRQKQDESCCASGPLQVIHEPSLRERERERERDVKG
jgi:hypothetical protein